MIGGKFYLTRSCNDDYVPNYVLIDNIKPDERLETIDAKLEALYNTETIETAIIESHDERLDNDEDVKTILEDAKMICDYAKDHKISITDAVEYLNSCHHCGNTDIPFGDEYCNERCQDYSIVFNYVCFRGAECKVCDTYQRHEYRIKERQYLEHKWYCKAIGCNKEFCDYYEEDYCKEEDEELYNHEQTNKNFCRDGQDTDDENEDTF